MGIAAYNRGSLALSRWLDEGQPSAALTLFRDLTDFSANHDGVVPFGETVVRFGPVVGEVTLMNRQAGGWRAYGYRYPSLWALARQWRVAFLSLDRDEHSVFIRVTPLGRKEPS